MKANPELGFFLSVIFYHFCFKLLYLICKSFTSTTNLVSFFFALKFFDYFSLKWAFSKPSLNSAMMESKTACMGNFFVAHFSSFSIKLFTGAAKILQNRFVSSEVHLQDGYPFPISLCFILFFSFSAVQVFMFSNFSCSFWKIKQHLKVQESRLCLFVVEICWIINLHVSDINIHYNIWLINAQ